MGKSIFRSGAILVFLVLIIPALFAQEYDKASRVKIWLDNEGLSKIASLDIDLAHGNYVLNKSFDSDFNSFEIQQLKDAGINFDILIEDVEQYYISRNLDPDYNPLAGLITSRSNEDCNYTQSRILGDKPVNFSLGTIGGFHRYAEIISHLDRMYELYPNLITAKSPIGNYQTFKNNPIYHLKISTNPDQNNPLKPKVLYTSLHHAREPISVTQLLYFMWYLLENYEKDDFVKAILDNYELYFIPIVNPDGYLHNEQNSPQGGGSHRKNLMSYDGVNTGVDLNRNYPYNWGFNNQGSSGNHQSQIYRGPSAASEPEIQAIIELCETVPFDIAMNNHAAGNLLIHPWGYTQDDPEELNIFRELGQEMTRNNAFTVAPSHNSKSVNYGTNGSADDYMYGEMTTKNKTYSFTPEIGLKDVDNFWPHISRIEPLCIEMLHSNIVSAAMLGNYGLLMDASADYIHSTEYDFEYNLKRLGLRGGEFHVNIIPLSPNITEVEPSRTFQLAEFESVFADTRIKLDPGIQDGEEVRFVLSLDFGIFTRNDTITRVFYSGVNEIFSDEASSMDIWEAGQWSLWTLSLKSSFSPPYSYSTTPSQTYFPGNYSFITLKEPFDLRDATSAYLKFKIRYAIEPKYDQALIEASVNGTDFEHLCGKLSKISKGDMYNGLPTYEGFQEDWAVEVVDLKEYLGGLAYLRLGFVSDDNYQFDGIFIDDMKVVVSGDVISDVESADLTDYDFQIFPNPSSGQLYYRLSNSDLGSEVYQLRMYNMVGQLVHVENVQAGTEQNRLLNPGFSSGIYTYQLMGEQSILHSGKFIMR